MIPQQVRRLALAAVATAVLVAVSGGGAVAGVRRTHAPGPRLNISSSQLKTALACSPGLRRAKRDPVLLTPAFSTGAESYGWNYAQRLPAIGVPTCTLSLPDHGFGDLQRDARYDVAAIRWMAEVSGRKINLLGHQHGALDGLWALTYWPDLAAKVHDFISFETPYHGTKVASGMCRPGGQCPPAVWQITKGSRFLAALNRHRLPKGPIYTSVASLDDELIYPQPAASHLHGASNVILQHLCPGRVVDHFSVLGDAVAYDVVIDAIGHHGPVRLSRLPANACQKTFMPGVSPAAFAKASTFLTRFATDLVVDAVPNEPAIARYARRGR